VQKDPTRDEALEAILRRTFPAADTGAPVDCPDADTVAAWSEGTLPAAATTAIETHLSDCARCQAVLAAFVRATPEPAAPVPFWPRMRLPWLVPIAAAATAVAVWIAMPGQPPQSAPELIQARQEDAVSTPPATQTPAAPAPDPAPPRSVPERGASVGAAGRATAATAGASAAAPGDDRAAPQEATLARERAAEANQTFADAATAKPAPAAPAPAPLAERREAAVLGQAVRPFEVVSPVPASRWRLTAGGQVEHSTSGGATWVPATVVPPAVLTAGASPAPGVCWLVGPAGAIRLTTDGLRFQAVAFPQTVDLVGVRADSARSAVVTTADGRAFRTGDQGATWTPAAP
jgi:hypothetical protein